MYVPIEAGQCIQIHVDGKKVPGHMPTIVKKMTAYEFLGRAPAVVDLFFSWEAVAAAEKATRKGGDYSRLHFKLTCDHHAKNETQLEWDHRGAQRSGTIAQARRDLCSAHTLTWRLACARPARWQS